MTKLLIVTMMFLVTSVLASGTAFAQTDTDQPPASLAMCSMSPTVQALRGCVLHAREIGAIKSAGVTKSLLIELDVAQSALDRGRPRVAIALLHSFVREVDALAGKQIMQPHADHLVMHARMVIQALGGKRAGSVTPLFGCTTSARCVSQLSWRAGSKTDLAG